MLDIREVIKKDEQGRGGVYQCIGEDESIYWVKGHNAGRSFQINEWIAGHLAQAFGLPIAPFQLVNIDEVLYQNLTTKKEIGFGPAFASKNAVNSAWFLPATMHPSRALQQDLLVFDYWIQNHDRTKENPNLLWLTQTSDLVVIDHNLAFDDEFDAQVFFGINKSDTQEPHIFYQEQDSIFTDLVRVDEYKQRMDSAISSVEAVISGIPDEWYYYDLEKNYEAEIDLASYQTILNRYHLDDFWSMK